MTTKTFVIAALALLAAASVSAYNVTVAADVGDYYLRSLPQSNSCTINSAGYCNLAGGVDNVGLIFVNHFTPPPVPNTNFTVMGDAGFTLYSYWNQPGYNFSADLWTIKSNWFYCVSTWESWIGSATDPGAYSNVLGEKVGTCNITAADAFGGGRSPTGTLSGAVIQDWLDNPGNNLGLALVNNPADGYNCCIRTVWWAENVNPAQTFEIYYDLVPEPVFLPLLAGLGFIAWRRMR
jgi:hypothetical protein